MTRATLLPEKEPEEINNLLAFLAEQMLKIKRSKARSKSATLP
jgi:hypothetical protein